MLQKSSYKFHWLSTDAIPDALFDQCAKLFSEHYGVWGESDPRAGERIRLSRSRLKEYADGQNGHIAYVMDNNELVCYAFVVIWDYSGRGKIAWVTQLVCHSAYRERKLATRLLGSIWGFSDYYAWGLVTANPFAVRALEGATERLCLCEYIEREVNGILKEGGVLIPYIKDRPYEVNLTRSVINTDFKVSHEWLEEMINKANASEPWRLGTINEGEEWIAFTFKDQSEDPKRITNIRLRLADSDKRVMRAYEGMNVNSQAWTKYTSYEAKFAIKNLSVNPGDRILDIGCGQGRHSVQLAMDGFDMTGIDFIHSWVGEAKRNKKNLHLNSCRFLVKDARKYRSKNTFDAILCLYDVVGSFAEEAENQRIINQIAINLKQGGLALISVMSMPLTRKRAKHFFSISKDTRPLMQLKPSKIMQDSGNVFNPDYYVIDTDTEIVYRKEQFDLDGHNLPEELIIRDRRYDKDEISRICETAGLNVVWSRYVNAGNWDTEVEPSDAKEVLVLVKKE